MRERGLKSTVALTGDMTNKVAPVRERGLKFEAQACFSIEK